MIAVPPTLSAVGTLVALWLAVQEARRVRGGDRRARPWFVFFVASAAIMTIFGVDALLRSSPTR